VGVIEEGIDYPLFVHCNSGKDRTGVVSACLLLILGVPVDVIVREYMLSEGKVHEQTIMKAIDGIGSIELYLRRVDLGIVRKALRGE
jgi:protein tyrosine/serine phosphatase